MNPIAQTLLIGFLCLLAAFFFGGLMNLNHAACQADRNENDLGIPPDREFTEVGTVAPRGPLGRIEIVCANCKQFFPHLRALPNGNVVCPSCHEKLILDAVFTPLE